LYCALCLVCAYTLWLVHARGYEAVVACLSLLVPYLLWGLRRDPRMGAQLRWCQGRWTLEHAGALRVITPGKRSTTTPWVIYLAFTEQPAGPGGHLWLYADCASAAQWRRLRVRLTLEC
jgi:hypothetical protein